AAQGIEKCFALERDAFFHFAWDDLLIVRIVALNQFGNEQGVVKIERDLPAPDTDPDVAFISEQALQFRDRLGWDDDVGLVAARKFQADVEYRTPAPVGRDERELVILKTEEHAIEDIAGLVGRNGVGGL